MPPKKGAPVPKKTASKPKPQQKKAEAAAAPVVVTTANETITLKQITQLLSPSPEAQWFKSGKWPCILDPGTSAGTFLRYRNTNYLSAVSQEEMSEERIRLALIGGLRFGKPMIIDMEDADMFQFITAQVNNIQAGLMDKVLDRSIVKEENFKTLVKDSDPDDYSPSQFTGGMADQFVFIVLTSRDVPPPNASDKMYYMLIE